MQVALQKRLGYPSEGNERASMAHYPGPYSGHCCYIAAAVYIHRNCYFEEGSGIGQGAIHIRFLAWFSTDYNTHLDIKRAGKKCRRPGKIKAPLKKRCVFIHLSRISKSKFICTYIWSCGDDDNPQSSSADITNAINAYRPGKRGNFSTAVGPTAKPKILMKS